MVADVLTRPLLSACEQHFAVSLGCARSPFRLIYLFFFFFFPVLCFCASRHTPSRLPRTPPPPPGQKLKQPRHRKASTTTTPAPASRASPTYVPSTVSACGLWLACDQPPSSLHKETAAVELPAHVRAHSVCLPPFFFFFYAESLCLSGWPVSSCPPVRLSHLPFFFS